MKKRSFTVAVLGSLLLGCASQQPAEFKHVLDTQKIANIEAKSKASSSPITTVWVNPPRKKVKRDQSDNN